MRILLINGNTSTGFTERIAAIAQQYVSPGTEVTAVTAEFGVSLIRTRSDSAIAAHAVLAAFAKYHEGHDAAVLAVSTDTGLAALRQAAPVPVVGMTEASLHLACLLGSRFGVLVFDCSALPVFRELVVAYGLLERMAGIEGVQMTSADFQDPDHIEAAARDAVARLIDYHGAECVVLTGATTAGLAQSLQKETPRPILDGLSCGIVTAEALVRLRRAKPRTGSYAFSASENLTSIDPCLEKFLSMKPV